MKSLYMLPYVVVLPSMKKVWIEGVREKVVLYSIEKNIGVIYVTKSERKFPLVFLDRCVWNWRHQEVNDLKRWSLNVAAMATSHVKDSTSDKFKLCVPYNFADFMTWDHLFNF